jgi:death-on-curing protein
MRYLTVAGVLLVYDRIMRDSGGGVGLRDVGDLESAVAQPRMGFGGQELYPTLPEKAAALGFSLIRNHPFLDGNKRAGHAAMEIFLVLNGYELNCVEDEQYEVILKVASGEIERQSFAAWLSRHIHASALPTSPLAPG